MWLKFSISPDRRTNTLHLFQDAPDGCYPNTELHALPSGKEPSFVGATMSGGTPQRRGTVFELTEHNGSWRESVIYAFADRKSGAWPADLLVDSKGNIFGVTNGGGAHDQGAVFELSESGGQWTEKPIYSFANNSDGENPVGLCLDAETGTLYGTTTYGGAYFKGTVFSFTSIRWRLDGIRDSQFRRGHRRAVPICPPPP